MPSLGNATFKGASGKEYRFRVFAFGTRFRKLSGVFAVTNRASSGNGGHQHHILYVGQTEDCSQPFARHRKADVFKQHGADCICLLSDNSEQSRLAKKHDLVAAFHPVWNH
jgi:hypothetical protein